LTAVEFEAVLDGLNTFIESELVEEDAGPALLDEGGFRPRREVTAQNATGTPSHSARKHRAPRVRLPLR
jgi:hypothetical protein